MLGIPTTSTLNTPVDYATSSPYYSAFAQEAWRATSKLTVNLGLRFEVEQGMTETADRMITSVRSRLRAGVRRRGGGGLRAKPDSRSVGRGVPRKSPRRRRLRRANGQSRRGWKSQVMWLPRASAAYQVNDGMVVKGGYGVYYDSLNATAITPNQLGFSTVTTVPSSNDFGQTWVSGNPRAGISPLVDPFPVRADGTRFVDAGRQRRSAGISSPGSRSPTATSIASTRGCSGGARASRKSSAATWRSKWRMSARIPTTSTSVEPRVRQDSCPSQYWNHTRDAERGAGDREQQKRRRTRSSSATSTALRASNPALYNQLAAQALFTSPTIQKNRLLRPFPHMSVGTTVFRLRRCRSARFARMRWKWRSSAGSRRASA